MATYIEMPKLSDTMTEGTLLKWHVKEGDEVSVGDVIADVETDKATMEMEAVDGGLLGKLYVSEGDKVPLGSYLAALVEEGEDAPDSPPAAPVAVAAPTEAKSSGGDRKSSRRASASAAPTGGTIIAATTSSGRIKASPLARKIAADRGVNIGTIQGTGPGGRIVAADVENAPVGGGSGGGGYSGPEPIRPTMDFDPKAERLPLSGMRTIIADRLSVSKATVPHFYLNVELDAEPLMKMRKQVNESAEAEGNKFSVNDFILKAAIMANVDVPEVNASWDVESIVQYKSVNLSVAIAIPDGLVTPVIKDSQDKTMLEISKAVKDLAERAKNKKLSPDEFTGGTFTVSNLGAYGVDNFDAIINPPQAFILSVGGIKKLPVVNEAGEIVPGMRMWIGMSCDHRVIDGAVGATYMQALKKYLENPALMLV